jgi:hypothetical protein
MNTQHGAVLQFRGLEVEQQLKMKCQQVTKCQDRVFDFTSSLWTWKTASEFHTMLEIS